MVVLDNCEHVVAACAELTHRLLEAAPHLRILATSREALGLASEMTMRVPSLSVPESDDELSSEALSKYEAIQLFVDRAQLKQPDFQITEENAHAGFLWPRGESISFPTEQLLE